MSRDENMLRICREVRDDPSKNVYVEIMKAAGVAKQGDTQKTVGTAYKDWKIGGLAVLYGQEAMGLAKNLNIRYVTAKFIYDFFHTHFSTYWRFIGNQVVRGQSPASWKRSAAGASTPGTKADHAEELPFSVERLRDPAPRRDQDGRSRLSSARRSMTPSFWNRPRPRSRGACVRRRNASRKPAWKS